MKPTGFNTGWTTAKVASDENDISILVKGQESKLENPLLGIKQDNVNKSKTWAKLGLLLIALLGITCFVLALTSSERFVKLYGTGIIYDDAVTSFKGVVTSDDARCSKVGVSMLDKGGNAVDAAIATALCLGVVSPTESGIGGGAFMVIRIASTSKVFAYNMRETAPAAASQDMYEHDKSTQVKGPLSIAVPGELLGLREAWEKHGSGRLKWKTLFRPAIKYARDGFKVYPYLAHDLHEFQDDIKNDKGLTQVFMRNEKPLKEGDICYNTQLAKTLQKVADYGPEVFYNGEIGKNLIKDVKELKGILKMKDLRDYKVDKPDVFEDDIMGYKILGMPPPSSGTVGLTMVANILINYGLNPDDLNGARGLHRLTEAIKYMQGMKLHLGDPNYDDVSKLVKKMKSPCVAKDIWKNISDDTSFPAEHYEHGWKDLRDHGTSHLGVVDAERNAVALTTSLNDQFGSKILSPSTGIVLNNQMRDFSLPDNSFKPPANLIKPGKRPLSSMTPLIILKDGQLVGVIGGSGGPNIIAAITQVFLNNLILKMNPRDSVHAPRIYPKLDNSDPLHVDVDYEDETLINKEHIVVPEEYMTDLKQRGHNMSHVGFAASCHLIVQNLGGEVDMGMNNRRMLVGDDASIGLLTAVGDPRKDSKPAAQ